MVELVETAAASAGRRPPLVELVETPAASAGRWLYVGLRVRSGRRG
ncbi:hypothetical protein [Nocardioides sp.]|nr:hypothetical protein [Nocardioides sp.]